MNGFNIGGRALIVNTADNDSSPSAFPQASSLAQTPMAQPAVFANQMPQQPSGPPSFGIEAVNAVLSSLSNQQLSDVILQFKVCLLVFQLY